MTTRRLHHGSTCPSPHTAARTDTAGPSLLALPPPPPSLLALTPPLLALTPPLVVLGPRWLLSREQVMTFARSSPVSYRTP
jgi:hypothetical protein